MIFIYKNNTLFIRFEKFDNFYDQRILNSLGNFLRFLLLKVKSKYLSLKTLYSTEILKAIKLTKIFFY